MADQPHGLSTAIGSSKAQVKRNATAKKPYSKPTITAVEVSTAAPIFPKPTSTTSALEDVLRAIAAELGLGRAVEVLEGERARVRAVIGA